MNVRSILSWSVSRKLNLVEKLFYSENGCTTDELLQLNQCSYPILSQDLIEIHETYDDFKIEKKNKLFYLIHSDDTGIDVMIKRIIEDSFELNILELLFYETCTNLTDLAEHAHLSISSAHRVLKKISDALLPMDIHVSKNPLHISGNEATVRNFFLKYFYEKKTLMYEFCPTPDLFLFSNHLIFEFIEANQLYESLYGQEHISYCFYTSLIRVKNGHYILEEELISKAMMPLPEAVFQKYAAVISKDWHVPFTDLEYKNCFWPFYTDQLMMSLQQGELAKTTNPSAGKLFDFCQRYITFLALEYSFNFSQHSVRYDKLKDQIILGLYSQNALYDYGNQYVTVLSDLRKHFVMSASQKYPTQVQQLAQSITDFFKSEGTPLSDEALEQQLYIIIVLYPAIIKKISTKHQRIHMVIFSSLNANHESFLAEMLHEKIKGNLEFHFISRIAVRYERIDEFFSNYDLLVTTQTLNHIIMSIPQVVVEAFPSQSSINKIQKIVDTLNLRKEQQSTTAPQTTAITKPKTGWADKPTVMIEDIASKQTSIYYDNDDTDSKKS